MTYQRKTRDYWDIEQQFEAGWEVVSACMTWKETRQELREYRENQPEFPVRSRKRRERIVQ